jgi:YidC/Oxa1 family membrane protein insertase
LEAGTNAPRVVAATNVPEELQEWTNSIGTNPIAHYTFTSHGGGIKEIELLRYPETVATRIEKQPEHPRVATLNKGALVPTLAVLDGYAVQGDGVYTLTRLTNGMRAEKTLTNGLVLTKDFEFTSNYLITARIKFENRSTKPLPLPAQEWVVGTATPLGPRDTGRAVGVMWYNGNKSQEVGGSTYFSSGGCSRRVAPLEYRNMGASNAVWAAVHNQYFTIAMMPDQPAQDVVVERIDLPHPTGDDARYVATNAPPPQGFEAAMVYPGLTLAPNQIAERKILIYAGPKEYQTLARLSAELNNNIDLVMNFGWASFVSKALLLGMNKLHEVFSIPYGWAIVVITVLIKAVFWPLTRASTRSMKRMQALQPQMNAIKEKYKDDPVKMNRKTMEFMKENKVSPLGGCLPMLIQIPVFFGFYQMIQSVIELRGAHFLWVRDLSQPDTLFIIPGLDFIPVFGIPGVGLPFNLLPLIMGATMLWQARLTPPSPGMDPAQAKMMRYMPLIFMVGLYNFSAGLTLYWTVNNLLTIFQTKLTKALPEEHIPPPAVKGPVLTAPQKKRK